MTGLIIKFWKEIGKSGWRSDWGGGGGVELYFRHVKFGFMVNSQLKLFTKKPSQASDVLDNRYVLGRLHIHKKQTYGEWILTAKYYLHFSPPPPHHLHLFVDITLTNEQPLLCWLLGWVALQAGQIWEQWSAQALKHICLNPNSPTYYCLISGKLTH